MILWHRLPRQQPPQGMGGINTAAAQDTSSGWCSNPCALVAAGSPDMGEVQPATRWQGLLGWHVLHELSLAAGARMLYCAQCARSTRWHVVVQFQQLSSAAYQAFGYKCTVLRPGAEWGSVAPGSSPVAG